MALLQVEFASQTLGENMQMNVILPQRTQENIGKPIPTLYLLHGMGGDHNDWMRLTSIERYVKDRYLAVIMPSTHMAWYTDMAYGLPFFTFLTEELPTICRSMFRDLSDRREDTFIAGLSMGGYGALKAALTRPENYCAAAALSAACDAVARAKRPDPAGAKRYWEGIFGTPEETEGSENDLYVLAKKCAAGDVMPELYQWCGTEDYLYEENTRLRDALKNFGFSLRYEESAGDHNWPYWDAKIQTVLDWLTEKNPLIR